MISYDIPHNISLYPIQDANQTNKQTIYQYMFVKGHRHVRLMALNGPKLFSCQTSLETPPELGWPIPKKWWSIVIPISTGLSLDLPWKNTTLHCGFFAWQVLTLNAWGSYFHWSHRGWGSHFLDLFEIQSLDQNPGTVGSPPMLLNFPIFSWSNRHFRRVHLNARWLNHVKSNPYFQGFSKS